MVSRRAALFAGGGVVGGAAAASGGWALADSPASASAATAASDTQAAATSVIPPDDDLMREHGVFKRVLLCYREMIARSGDGGLLSAAHVRDAALIIHDYIEGFHEGLEEGYVFPVVAKAGGVAGGTVDTLIVQHARGRVITQFLLTHATAGQLASPGMTARIAAAMQAFDRMYEPHEASA
jgi:hemerythrin-like domain-containing protein